MFDFRGRRGVKRPGQAERGQARGPVSIGFEQLEGRELLSAGVCLTIIPTETQPLANMPRPIVGRVNPEADAEGAVIARPLRVEMKPEPDRRWNWRWAIGGRFRLGPWEDS